VEEDEQPADAALAVDDEAVRDRLAEDLRRADLVLRLPAARIARLRPTESAIPITAVAMAIAVVVAAMPTAASASGAR
jgi:hypothetical protein